MFTNYLKKYSIFGVNYFATNYEEAASILIGEAKKTIVLHSPQVKAVIMAVGATFDFHAKNIRRATVWMQKNSLEWLFRLAQDPKRLWKKILVYLRNTALS